MKALSRELTLISLFGGLLHVATACGQQHRQVGTRGGVACTGQLSQRTAEDVRAFFKEHEKGDGKLEPFHLDEWDCGPTHAMSINNGYGGWTFYLRGGVVIGESESNDYGPGSCAGERVFCRRPSSVRPR